MVESEAGKLGRRIGACVEGVEGFKWMPEFVGTSPAQSPDMIVFREIEDRDLNDLY